MESHFSTSVALIFVPANRHTAFDFELNDIQGLPGGMAIDTEGKLWVACFTGGQLKCKTHHYAIQIFCTEAL
jgi:sugar lactone lactonase YvrE